MPPLRAKERAQLPDSAFAYVDSKGKRRLPIHDASHVRNALARFGQVAFEDEAARDRARTKLLRAAQRHGIMPLGFISSQLDPQRRLPRGQVTFLLTDIEGSTELLARLGSGYADVLKEVRRRVRGAIQGAGGHVVSARGDDTVAAFAEPPGAVRAALATQRAMREEIAGERVRLRIGLHHGRPALTDDGYVGLSVHAAARLCFAAHGDQTILSAAVERALHGDLDPGVTLERLGAWRFRGLPEPIEVLQAGAADLAGDFPALRGAEPVASPA